MRFDGSLQLLVCDFEGVAGVYHHLYTSIKSYKTAEFAGSEVFVVWREHAAILLETLKEFLFWRPL
jgi:hypothetical protein